MSEERSILTVVIQADSDSPDRLGQTYRNLTAAELKFSDKVEFLESNKPLNTTTLLEYCRQAQTEYLVFVHDTHDIPRNYLPSMLSHLSDRTLYLAEPFIFDTKAPKTLKPELANNKYFYTRRTEIYGVCFNRRMLEIMLEASPAIDVSTVYLNYRLYWSITKVTPVETAYIYGSQTHIINGIAVSDDTRALFLTGMPISNEIRLGILHFLLLHLRHLKTAKKSPLPLEHYRSIISEYGLLKLDSSIALTDRFERFFLEWIADPTMAEREFKQLSGQSAMLKFDKVEPADQMIPLYQIIFADECVYISKFYAPKTRETSGNPINELESFDYYDLPVTPSSTILVYDRSTKADDNAEHFYRFLQANHPEFENVYFALSKTSTDWERLEAEGFKMVEIFKPEFYRLFLESDLVISSQMYPIQYKGKNFTNSRFLYLQHGIQLNDMTDWAVAKFYDAFIVTGRPEMDYMSAFAPVETKNTGIPRLASVERRCGPDTGDIVFMPTWRFGLHNVGDSEFRKSEFYRRINDLLSDAELIDYLTDSDRRLVVKLHPNLMKRQHLFDFSERVILSDASYQEVIENAAVVITDYSSVVCDAAFVGIPIIYYQWDELTFFDEQTYSQRLNYRDQGLGPVFTALSDLRKYLLNEEYGRSNEEFENRRKWFFDGVDADRINERILDIALQL